MIKQIKYSLPCPFSLISILVGIEKNLYLHMQFIYVYICNLHVFMYVFLYVYAMIVI